MKAPAVNRNSFPHLRILLLFLLLFLGQKEAAPVLAQMSLEEFNARLEAMETENASLRAQIESQSAPVSAPVSVPVPVSAPAADVPAETPSPIPDLEIQNQLRESARKDQDSILLNMAEDDLEGELARYKNWQWSKDSFTFTPYVWFWLTGTHETNQMFAGDYPLWVRNTDRSHTYFDMKATRLGLNLTAPEVDSMPGVKLTGVLETDFQNTYVTENRPDIELRKAYLQFQNENFSFLFGQTWELLSPLYPTVLNWGFGSGGGNFGFRRPQVRFDRYFKRNDGRLALQTCVLSSNTNNFSAADGTTYTGKMGRWPEFQLRLERTFNEGTLWKSAMFAAGAKIGEKEYLTDSEEFHRTSWAFTADTKIRFTDRFFMLGEFYVGELLAVNCAAIMQDLNPRTRENVGSTGGWLAFGWDLTPEVHYSVGASIDDVWNSSICEGMRAKNYFIFTNISRDLTKAINVGFEYEYYETEYFQLRNAHSHLFMICSMIKI